MFGKIKNRLKGVFEKQEEVVEESGTIEDYLDEGIVENKVVEEIETKPDEKQEEAEEVKSNKKGFLSRVFGSKNEREEMEELENLNDEEIVEDEKETIKENNELKQKKQEENKNKIGKKIKKEEELVEDLEDDIISEEIKDDEKDEGIVENIEDEQEEKKEGFLSKTFGKLKSKKITEEDFEKIWVELEIFLLEINVAYEIVEKIGGRLKEELINNSFDRFKLNQKIREVLEKEVEKVLIEREGDLIGKIKQIRDSGEVARIIILGVNGTGKTTSIAKFVNYLQNQNLNVVVAAADTFRAAAIEQLDEHAKNLNFKLIKHQNGSDPAAVAFDAIEHARAKNLDVVLIDTAGRMPNNSNLMTELQKINRVSKAQLSIFIGDSISGNDLIEQINLFDKGVEIDGVILTKVDTDERPGSIITTAYSIDKPIYFLGVGQGYDDLVKFDAKKIAKELFSLEED